MRSLIQIGGLMLAGAAVVAACASAGAPPGGPERKVPPEITSISVDSGQTNVKIKSVEFKFDEVVSDRPAGAATGLDQIFLISPRNGAAVVSWHRTRVDVRPKNGFKPNTAYRITMLPGLVDLRGNQRKDTRTVLFSTGETFPPYSIHGQVFDWTADKTATGAYIEAVSVADTNVVYVTASDTLGLFDAGPLPAGSYTVHALIDKNDNRALDRNEKWDTTTVTITGMSAVVELDAIERDSTPPVIDNIVALDSVTLRVSFDKPLDPALPLQPALVRVNRPDSSALQVTAVQWAAAYDRARTARLTDSTQRADSTRVRPPGTPPPVAPRPPAATTSPGQRPPPPPPKPKSPAPDRAIIVNLSTATPVLVGQKYVITVSGFRNLVGNAHDSHRLLDVPKPPPPRKPAVDSAGRALTDTTRRPPPSIRK